MFLQNLRAKVGARLKGDREAGFTLIELLVVMLILGILAAIALPSFFNQKDKAGDAKAKGKAHAVQVAMETCATDNNNTYNTCNLTALEQIEPTIDDADPSINVETLANQYVITVKATGGSENEFSIERDSNGNMTFSCEDPGEGGCPNGGDWS